MNFGSAPTTSAYCILIRLADGKFCLSRRKFLSTFLKNRGGVLVAWSIVYGKGLPLRGGSNSNRRSIAGCCLNEVTKDDFMSGIGATNILFGIASLEPNFSFSLPNMRQPPPDID